MREVVATAAAPTPKGPYSQAIVSAGRQLWIAGQLPLDPATGALVGSEIERQAEQVFANLQALAEAAGGSLAQAVKVQIYLHDNADFARMNAVYERFFPQPRPARTTIQSSLRGILIEADAVIALE
jgi:2-iminobutanoate/2-iminopropanoate deaminase